MLLKKAFYNKHVLPEIKLPLTCDFLTMNFVISKLQAMKCSRTICTGIQSVGVSGVNEGAFK
jgi:hypothetical protein